ncbi:MAG TPA: GNAT family N-acetyltransferase [Oceanospirillaceae bacterium]|nr:GNAT family N-acetyltransferase [Oceanospirillaceae bacterium]
MSISIAYPTSADKEQWQNLYYGYASFYKMPMNQTILDQVWNWIHDDKEKFHCLLAKDESGQAVGFMHFRAMVSPLRGAHVGFLDDLFVLPECRGEQIVEQLFARLEEEAKQQGWPAVRWITAEDNYRARAVYDRLSDQTIWKTYQLNVKR